MHIVSGNVYAEKAIAEPVGVAEPIVEPVVAEPQITASEPQVVTETYEATAYIAMCDTGCSGITATGVDVKNTIYSEGYRVIATDPNVIALGSIVRITLADGSSFEAISADTGGAIRGHKVDLLVVTESEAWGFGRQAVEIEVIRRGSD